MEMGYADWVVAKYLANYSIRWIAFRKAIVL